MRYLAIFFTSLLLGGCAARQSCPTIDEDAMARRIVDDVFRNLDREADEAEDRDEPEVANVWDEIPFEDLPCRGNRTAEVRLVVASDFQCPFCSRFAGTVDRLVREKGDKILLCFLNYPLPFHENAQMAAEAAVEAQAQGGEAAFFRMHDQMFAHQNALGIDDLVRYAMELGLDGERMRAALVDRRHSETVDEDVELATELGVSGTPTTFVEGEEISGAVPYADLDEAVQAAIDAR